MAFSQELFGSIPEKIQTNTQYWTLVDLDNDKNTGANEIQLQKIGVPRNQASGADLVIRAEGSTNNATGDIWIIEKGDITSMSPRIVQFDIQNMSVHLDTAGTVPPSKMYNIPLYSTINAIFNNTGGIIEMDKPFSIQAVISSNGTAVDRLDETGQGQNTFELKQPLFPQCFVNKEEVLPGEDIMVNVSGLSPNDNIHALLGPRLVANSTTDNSGGGIMRFIIPDDTTSGFHLVTLGVQGTALTADCVINVQKMAK